MVRTYVRKTAKKNPDNIIRALRAVQNGMSIRAAARDFGLSHTSLRRQLGVNRWVVSQNSEEEIEVPIVEEIFNETATETSETSTDVVIASIPDIPTSTPMRSSRSQRTATATTTTATVTSTPVQPMPFITNFVVSSPGGQTVCVFTFHALGSFFYVNSSK